MSWVRIPHLLPFERNSDMERKILASEELRIFRDTVREIIKSQIVPEYEKWEDARMVPREAWLEAGRQGWLCPEASEEFGGMGASLLYTVILTEELYYHGVSGFFIPLHNGIVYPYIDRFGTPEQKKKWTPGCVSGETILALAMSEPCFGSDIAHLTTEARRDGDYYVLNGSKTFISNGQLADLFVVAVRTDPKAEPAHRGISLILVDSNCKGFSRGKNLDKVGFHAQDTSEIFFEDCRVPVANLLGKENEGFKYLMQNLQQERLVLAIGAAAAAAGSLDLTVEYVKTRHAFGQPLSKFQNTRFKLAEAAARVSLAQSYLDDLIVRHLNNEKLVKEVSIAKYWITETQFQVADDCLQLFGGYGYMREYPISRYFVDARVQRVYGGSNEIMKELIARELGL